MIAMTRTMNGNANTRSTMRMANVPNGRPKWPANRPYSMPTTSVTDVAPNAIARS